MLKNKCPIDIGNAAIITNKIAIGTNFLMGRLENIFDFFSEEPFTIMVKEEENSIEEEYTCILRIRFWNRMQKSSSWSIYSKDRENLNNIIIRRVIWDLNKDKEIAKNGIRENRAEALESWPSIAICNKYIFSPWSNHVIDLINGLDLEIKNGLILYENSNQTWEWRDLEMLRLYDWGQVHLTWCTDRKNEDLEKRIKELIVGLDFTIERINEDIFSMTLNYSVNPEEYKNSLCGKN
ncbi:MAG: hypothetical protein HDR22_11190 [Lachnospiraceae bacterium]|nr:hypothetical protein [Lachnospiraceae bacterium]